MGEPARNLADHFTYKDYKQWSDDERWELIDGEAYLMSPGPNRRHQGYLANFSDVFRSFFRGKPCKVYFAPFDVVLPEPGQDEDDAETVVQPDLLVVCDPSKLTFAGCTGAPDFVLEILSPSTAFRDMDNKLRLYERTGVKEYWVVNPANETVLAYQRTEAGAYGKPLLFSRDEVAEPGLFPGLRVDLNIMFED